MRFLCWNFLLRAVEFLFCALEVRVASHRGLFGKENDESFISGDKIVYMKWALLEKLKLFRRRKYFNKIFWSQEEMFLVFQFSNFSKKKSFCRFEWKNKNHWVDRKFGTNIFGFRTRDLTLSRIPIMLGQTIKSTANVIWLNHDLTTNICILSNLV